MTQTRRSFLGTAAASVAVAEAPAHPLAFGDRAHLFLDPGVKDSFIRCFSTVLGCGTPMSLKAPGMQEPILAFRFPGGGSLSVEFTDQALPEPQARRGAWLEIRSSDPAAMKKKILDAGLPQVHHPATNTFYFVAPGGQIFGIVPAANPAAGELKQTPAMR